MHNTTSMQFMQVGGQCFLDSAILQFMFDTETIIIGWSYVGIFVLMTLNGFLSFPSSQILYIIVGYFIGTDTLQFLPASFSGALGNMLGNIMLYEVVRSRGVHYLTRFQIFKESRARVEHHHIILVLEALLVGFQAAIERIKFGIPAKGSRI